MRLRPFVHERPASLEELSGVWERYGPEDYAYLAGGTDLLVKMRQRLTRPAAVISLNGLPGLRGIRSSGEAVVIGAATPLRDVARSPLIQRHGSALAQAAGFVASPQIRSMGTLGGNICLDTRCHFYNQPEGPGAFAPCLKRGGERCHVVPRGGRCHALFCADTPAALLVLDAALNLRGPSGARRMPLADLYREDGLRPCLLQPGEVVESVELPLGEGRESRYRRFSPRRAVDFPFVGVAVSRSGGRRQGSAGFRVAATGLGSRPLRLLRLEERLDGAAPGVDGLGELLDEALDGIRPVRHQGIGPAYRKRLLAALLEETLSGEGEGT